MAVFLHKQNGKFSANNHTEAFFMSRGKRHEMPPGRNEMPGMRNE
ncbi:hypothetical protein [Citrobacter freundii]|uniref:Uncharacterized protein n=1 Tax=Citrobacter freundii TaxID=546 RepID=A0A7G2IS03_CITFR|nr:hypothetical protein [Citrobacter freundii]